MSRVKKLLMASVFEGRLEPVRHEERQGSRGRHVDRRQVDDDVRLDRPERDRLLLRLAGFGRFGSRRRRSRSRCRFLRRRRRRRRRRARDRRLRIRVVVLLITPPRSHPSRPETSGPPPGGRETHEIFSFGSAASRTSRTLRARSVGRERLRKKRRARRKDPLLRDGRVRVARHVEHAHARALGGEDARAISRPFIPGMMTSVTRSSIASRGRGPRAMASAGLAGREHRVALHAQEPLDEPPHFGLVLDEEDRLGSRPRRQGRGAGASRSASGSSQRGR